MFVGDVVTFVHVIRDKAKRVVDISNAEILQLRFRRPDKDKSGFTMTATLHTDGIDGKLQYTTTPTTLNTYGKWQRQAYVKLPTGEWSGLIIDFAVEATLKGP